MSSSRTDQDSPWKTILEQHFQDCLQFFFPTVHQAIDWSRPYEFLDTELQQIAREAVVGRRYADKLAKVWLNSGEEVWILLHIEIQAKREANFAQRMSTYYHRILDRYDRPVVSMAILCDGSASWRPREYVQEMLGCRMAFTFLTVKLLDYRSRWAELETSPNPFATVVMTHLKLQETRKDKRGRMQWKIHLIRSLYEKGYGQQEAINLLLFIDWLLKLPQELEQEVWQAIEDYEQERVMPYVSSFERIGRERGRQEGRQEGLQEGRQEGLQAGAQSQAYRSLLQVLQHRFQAVPPELQSQLQQLTIAQLEAALTTALTVDSLEAFAASIPAPAAEPEASCLLTESDR